MVEKLTEQEWRDREDLRLHWYDFARCDYYEADFAERMEAAGLVYLRAVDDDDLEQFFADELGIELGGMVWDLTPAGRALLTKENGRG